MLYNHSSGGNGNNGDGGGTRCSIRAQQRARASGPCCPLSSRLSGLQAASGCSQGDPGLGHAGAQLPRGSQQDRGTGPLLSWRAWGRAQTVGNQALSQRIWVSLGPRAVALLTITPIGRAGPKEGGGRLWGTGRPLRWTCWAGDTRRGHCSWNQPQDCREQQLSLGHWAPRPQGGAPDSRASLWGSALLPDNARGFSLPSFPSFLLIPLLFISPDFKEPHSGKSGCWLASQSCLAQQGREGRRGCPSVMGQQGAH